MGCKCGDPTSHSEILASQILAAAKSSTLPPYSTDFPCSMEIDATPNVSSALALARAVTAICESTENSQKIFGGQNSGVSKDDSGSFFGLCLPEHSSAMPEIPAAEDLIITQSTDPASCALPLYFYSNIPLYRREWGRCNELRLGETSIN